MLAYFTAQRSARRARVARQRQDERLASLYSSRSVETTPLRGGKYQAERLGRVVSAHCDRAQTIVGAHGEAATKLDAAEYAFSSMLDELRGVMTTLPTDWTPTRQSNGRGTPLTARLAAAA